MAVRLIDSLATTGPLAEIFSDQGLLESMLRFEAALARAEAGVGAIPRAAAAAISAAANSARLDTGSISSESAQSGTPAIPFVRAFTDNVRTRDPEAAGFVHWGATSQDLCDTAMVLLLQKARPILDGGLARVERALRRLSQQHRRTV